MKPKWRKRFERSVAAVPTLAQFGDCDCAECRVMTLAAAPEVKE
jgi:hypothetical protein